MTTKHRKSPGLFQKKELPTLQSEMAHIIEDAPEALRPGLKQYALDNIATAAINEDAKIHVLRETVKVAIIAEPLITSALNDENILQTLVEKTALTIKEVVKNHQQEILTTLQIAGGTIGGILAQTHSGFGWLALFLSLATVGAGAAVKQQSVDPTVFGGVPREGTDYCGPLDFILCKQAYIGPREDTKTWFSQVFTRLRNTLGGTDDVDTSLLTCFNAEKVANATKYLYAEGLTGNTISCTAVRDHSLTRMTAFADNLPVTNCTTFENIVEPIYKDCVTYSNDVLKWFGVSIGGIAGVAALVGLVCLTVYCVKESSCCRRSHSSGIELRSPV